MRSTVGVVVLALLVLVRWPQPACAQVFTRITDPSNPIVTQIAESGGGSWEDLNGDGLLDLFIAKGNLSNQNDGLYLNLGGFLFQAVVTGPVVSSGGSSIGGAWGDWNADGLRDLFVTNRASFGNFLFRGAGDTTFVRETTGAPVTDVANSNSAAWLDLDLDGDLDLYVVNFAADDFFYRNEGAPVWTLTRVVLPTIGIGGEFSIHGTWGDVDNDGDLDLFVADGGPQNDDLYLNQGNLVFTRRTLSDAKSTIGASWGDYDEDGDLDLFATSNLDQASVLYRNEGAPTWTLAPVSAAVFPGLVASAVGSAWGDVDNDGDLDLLAACDNGQNEALFLNQGPPTFAFVAASPGPLVGSGGNSFGCSFADIDRDGDLDVFVANRSNQLDFLFRNESAPGSWLDLKLRGPAENSSAIGARVRVLASPSGVPRWQTQQVLPSTGYNCQNTELHFGLGESPVADSIEISWPSGSHQVVTGVSGGRVLEVREGEPAAVPTLDRGGASLALAGPNPSRGTLRLALTLEHGGAATLTLVDVLGRVRARRDLGVLAAGRTTAELGATLALEPGLYWVRARIAGTERSLRVAILH